MHPRSTNKAHIKNQATNIPDIKPQPKSCKGPESQPKLSVLRIDLLALDYMWEVYACAPMPEQQLILAHLYHCAASDETWRDAVLQAVAEYVTHMGRSMCR
jgi:hypothetical protein